MVSSYRIKKCALENQKKQLNAIQAQAQGFVLLNDSHQYNSLLRVCFYETKIKRFHIYESYK